jgi:hypothetical protein
MTTSLAILATVLAGSATANASSPPPAAASRGLVVVLSPESEDEVTRNAMARIRGELAAAPFSVVSQPIDGHAELMVQVETAGQHLAPVAAFAIVRDPGDSPSGVAVWVSNRITRTTTVHRVAVRAGDIDGAAAALAIEAVELVRASMAGLWPSEKRTPDADEGGPVAVAARRLALAIGVGAIAALEDAPLFFAPTLGVAVSPAGPIGLRLSAFGLGPGADVSGPGGSVARLQRAALSLGALGLFREGRIVQPMVSLAGGVHYFHVQGAGAMVDSAEHALTAWSALLTAGAGCAFALGSHIALTAELDALLTWPTQIVEVAGAVVARFERPSLFAHGGLLARF